ncbi:MAG: diacylglycerol kinase family lipid kinase [Proteobacteria bacterium]|nr:diacylglycerol kinase family lipid kinase [Pseudomonadota bacterium]
MKTVVVANPRAAAGKVRRQWKRYEQAIFNRFGMSDVQMTTKSGEATTLVREAVQGGAEQIVVVGGDGTLNEAANGFFGHGTGQRGSELPSLVYLPAGTGGDFARSLGLSDLSMDEALKASSLQTIDIGRVDLGGPSGEQVTHYFINIASFGVSGLIVEKVNQSSKLLGGRASFLIGTLKGLYSWRDRRVRLRVDDAFDEEMTISTVAVANGRYFGGGMKVAPNALVNDEHFDVMIVEGAGIAKFIKHSRKIYRGTHLNMPEVTALTGKIVSAEPADDIKSPIPVETDGEMPGYLPMRCTVLPRAVELMAPWSRAEAI